MSLVEWLYNKTEKLNLLLKIIEDKNQNIIKRKGIRTKDINLLDKNLSGSLIIFFIVIFTSQYKI